MELPEYNTVLLALDSIIQTALNEEARESRYPSANPDQMDDRLKFYRERVIRMRQIREQFEDEMGRCAP